MVKRLHDAGAVLIAKLSLGALALNDIWFGGQTMNPWLLEEGASGSSAGPGRRHCRGTGRLLDRQRDRRQHRQSRRCAAASPDCGPTFGRVPRTGAMTLCWSLDKLGPMTRGVEDAMLVLQAISGPDAGDLSSVPSQLDFDAGAPVRGLRVGYFPGWMAEPPATDVDRAALETREEARHEAGRGDASRLALWIAESDSLRRRRPPRSRSSRSAAASKELKMQVPDAWPNIFRQSRFLSAVDFVQADRLRRKVAQEMARMFADVDVLLVPSLRDEMLTISNFTGHPSLTLRAGFVEVTAARSDWAPDPAHPLPTFSPPRRVPHGVTLIGRLFEEGTIGERRPRPGARLQRHRRSPTQLRVVFSCLQVYYPS